MWYFSQPLRELLSADKMRDHAAQHTAEEMSALAFSELGHLLQEMTSWRAHSKPND